ncbi:MAG TPA: DNA-binding domain-containing protein [Pseudomonadales bacterium]|nr:DNA-binding domain-containing protein [Pseudomonadales bacterium]HMW15396.1 DNA-binding domain-containing protein [Pseudomonadales bacterium]HMW83532.1 DNA-binding domain-containing protein [Pseudomonadales bacterium]HMZ71175.1 DNA-binding domain-containing protein [Pseudomonadales bacterium]HNB84264.1 DNA-binding domain-containing protein [Pseudomonadales bacterium]
MNHSLFEALLDPTLPTPAGLRVWNGSDPAARFAIHRNHLRVSLTSALAQSYPVTRTLVGEPFFNAMAWQFIRQAPPRLPMLACHGAALPNFIDSFAPAATLPYLADVARLEWLRIEACHAADAVELPTASLTRQLQQPATLARLKITFQPSVRLLTSRHAVVSIWAAHQGRGDLRAVDPVLPESALILRPQLDVELIPLPLAAGDFIGRLLKGEPLGSALEAHLATTADFDLVETLRLLIASGAIAALESD